MLTGLNLFASGSFPLTVQWKAVRLGFAATTTLMDAFCPTVKVFGTHTTPSFISSTVRGATREQITITEGRLFINFYLTKHLKRFNIDDAANLLCWVCYIAHNFFAVVRETSDR